MSKTPQNPRRRTQMLIRKLQVIPQQILAQPTPDAVHQFRTTIRRFEILAATPPASETDGLGKLLKQIGRLRRRAGKVRDVQVQEAALRTVRAGNKRDKAELKQALEREEEKRARKLVRAVHSELANDMEKRLKRAAAAFSEAVTTSAAADPGALASILDKFVTLTERQPRLNEENLHDFRIDCKHIRYEAEMQGDSLAAQRAVKQLKRIQDAIGEWHDWVNLSQSATDAVVNEHSPLLAAIRTGRQAKLNEALRITAEVQHDLLKLLATLKPAPADVSNGANPPAMRQAAS